MVWWCLVPSRLRRWCMVLGCLVLGENGFYNSALELQFQLELISHAKSAKYAKGPVPSPYIHHAPAATFARRPHAVSTSGRVSYNEIAYNRASHDNAAECLVEPIRNRPWISRFVFHHNVRPAYPQVSRRWGRRGCSDAGGRARCARHKAARQGHRQAERESARARNRTEEPRQASLLSRC